MINIKGNPRRGNAWLPALLKEETRTNAALSQNCIWKEKPKENLLAQKQITYGGELLHFEQQGKRKMAIQAKKKKDIYKGEKKKQTGLSHSQL